MTDCLSRLTTTMRRSRLPGLFAIAFLGPVVNATIPGPSTALLNYLRIGSVRVGLTSDTLLEHGKPVPLTWASFADVERMLGTAEMGARGDASTSLRWICYRLAGDVSMSLLLESDEIAGGEYIDNFELVPVRSRPDLEANCVPVNIPASAVETDRGIKLALTRREVEKRLGVAGGGQRRCGGVRAEPR